MHWKTYKRLTAEHDERVRLALKGMALRFNLLGESISDWLE